MNQHTFLKSAEGTLIAQSNHVDLNSDQPIESDGYEYDIFVTANDKSQFDFVSANKAQATEHIAKLQNSLVAHSGLKIATIEIHDANGEHVGDFEFTDMQVFSNWVCETRLIDFTTKTESTSDHDRFLSNNEKNTRDQIKTSAIVIMQQCKELIELNEKGRNESSVRSALRWNAEGLVAELDQLQKLNPVKLIQR